MATYKYSLSKDFQSPNQVYPSGLASLIRESRDITSRIIELGIQDDNVSFTFNNELSQDETNALTRIINDYTYCIPAENETQYTGYTGYTGPRGEQGATGYTGSSSCLTSNYFFSYDTTTQTQGASSFRDITFNTNGYINGWTHTTGTANFTCNESALYEFRYTAIVNSSAASNIITIVATDGSNNQISGSQTNIRVTSASMVIPSSNTFYAYINSGSVIKLRFYPTVSNGIITSAGNANVKTSIQFVCRRVD